jgi:hypothetical protein
MEQEIAEAVTNIVKLMVDKPDEVSVEVVPLPGGVVLLPSPTALHASGRSA